MFGGRHSVLVLALAANLGAPRAVIGQTGGGGRAASARGAAGTSQVMLQLRPKVGDTISMRMDQQTEVVGKREGKISTSAMITASMTFSRAVVESAVAATTTILAITDSILTTTSDGKTPAAAPQRQVQPQRVRLTVAPDGSIGMPNDGSTPAKGMSRAASLIPATFPTRPVTVGEKWSREAPLPSGTSQLGTGIVGRVVATFRLDSVTRNGELAYISMRGELLPDPSAGNTGGIAMVQDGAVEGYMVVDRARGWLTESSFTIVAHSMLKASFGVVAEPMYFEMKLTQKLRTVERVR